MPSTGPGKVMPSARTMTSPASWQREEQSVRALIIGGSVAGARDAVHACAPSRAVVRSSEASERLERRARARQPARAGGLDRGAGPARSTWRSSALTGPIEAGRIDRLRKPMAASASASTGRPASSPQKESGVPCSAQRATIVLEEGRGSSTLSMS